MTLRFEAGDYRLEIDPTRGGSILRFDWRRGPLMRPASGRSILDMACFPLVPFSNRIAHGRFALDGREVRLAPNFPGPGHPHPLHGFGWLATWAVIEAKARECVIEHRYDPGDWPWPYTARQTFALDENGLTLSLSLANRGETPMPAGLGFHPYFPRDRDTLFHGLHHGQWHNSPDCLPRALDWRAAPEDWWQGRPVGSRVVDTVYAGRQGALRIDWPSRGRSLHILPSDDLDHTAVFTPRHADYFCVEPVSHATDAVNAGSMSMLAPTDVRTVALRLEAAPLQSPAPVVASGQFE